MNKMLSKLLKTTKYVRSFFPVKLPTGLAEFNQFSSNIIEVYNLPNLPSYKHAIASMIMHLGPTTFHKSPRFFAISVKKSMANQTAYEMIQQIKEESLLRENERKREEQAKLTNGEATLEQANTQDESLPKPEVQTTSKDLVSKA